MKQDLRFAFRGLLKNPGFALAAVATLALGIGANTAIFSIVNALLLRPLALPHSERIVYIQEGSREQPHGASSIPDLRDYREQNTVFERIEGVTGAEVSLKGRERPERIPASAVTPGYLAMLGVPPLLGRAFADDEDQPGKNRAIVIREDVWRANLGGDPTLVGRTIVVNSEPYTLVGIMPAGFRYPSSAVQAWVPLTPDPVQLERGTHFMNLFGRLQPDATVRQAQTQMDGIFSRLASAYPKDNTGRHAILRTLHDEMVRNSRQELLILQGAVMFVFLIGCANVANLLLARAASRAKEFAIRRALGAGRWRLLRQFLAEAVLLAAAGTFLGLMLSLWGVDLLMSAPGMPQADRVAPDARVLLFTAGLSVLATLVMSLAGALQSWRLRVNDILKESGRGSSGARSAANMRRFLVSGEIAAAVVLFVGAGLLMESFWILYRIDPGFDASRVLTMSVSLPKVKYATDQSVTGFFDAVLRKASALPAVEAAAIVDALPLAVSGINADFEIEGLPPAAPGRDPHAEVRQCSPDYFRALGIPVLSGRAFSLADSDRAPGVVIVNQAFARLFFPNENPIGRRIRFEPPDWLTIVGISGDVKETRVGLETRPTITAPYTQSAHQYLLSMTIVARTSGNPAGMASALRKVIASVDPDQPVFAVRTMAGVVSDSFAGDRSGAIVMGAFAFLAALLAAIGIHGVISYLVKQRRQEVGIRMALGAGRGEIFRIAVLQGLKLAAAGIAIGIPAAIAVTRVMAGHIYVSVTDPLAYTAAPLFLAAVALVATILPAFSASRVDPLEALRHE